MARSLVKPKPQLVREYVALTTSFVAGRTIDVTYASSAEFLIRYARDAAVDPTDIDTYARLRFDVVNTSVGGGIGDDRAYPRSIENAGALEIAADGAYDSPVRPSVKRIYEDCTYVIDCERVKLITPWFAEVLGDGVAAGVLGCQVLLHLAGKG